MSRPTSIRFPDSLRERIDRARGQESFHAFVLALCWRGLETGPAEGGDRVSPSAAVTGDEREPTRKLSGGGSAVGGASEFRPDFKQPKPKGKR